jgi:hypothetical protein
MKIRAIVVASATVLALAACGGDDDGGSGVQGEVADMMIDAMNESFSEEGIEGIDLDEDCVRDAVGQLSDDDAQKILDAGPDNEPEGLSDEADEAAQALIDCVDIDLGG